MMIGDSPDVHCRMYRRWIDEGGYWAIYQRGISGSDRPSAPIHDNGHLYKLASGLV